MSSTSSLSGSLSPAAGGLIEVINHLHALRLTTTLVVETTGGEAKVHVHQGTVRAAAYRDRAGLTALTAAALLADGDFRLTAPKAGVADQIGLLTPALVELLRETTARVRSDYAQKGRPLPMDPVLGVPMPEADTTTDDLLANAKLTVRGREDDNRETGVHDLSNSGGGDFPDDFLGGLVPEEFRGGGEDLEPAKPSWIPPAVGQVLGKCYLTAEVGVGSSAIVYRALHMTLKIDVAVKVLTPDQNQKSRHINLREAQVLARLNHQNILRVLDCNDDEPYPHLVMEYVDGQPMSAMIQQAGRLSPATALGVILQSAEGLAYAAGEGVTHNDVKPGNLLVSRGQVVKVADLGVAAASFDSVAQDHGQAVVGTPAYISPELVLNGISRSGPASDIYSLGCTFFHAITGRPPFLNPDPIQLMVQHTQELPPAASSLVPDLDPEIDDLITSMLAKQPEDRPTYDELLAQLHRLRATLVQAGAVGPGMAQSDVPTAIISTLSSAWQAVRAALNKVLRPGSNGDAATRATRRHNPAAMATTTAKPAKPAAKPATKVTAPDPAPRMKVARIKTPVPEEKPRSRRVIKP